MVKGWQAAAKTQPAGWGQQSEEWQAEPSWQDSQAYAQQQKGGWKKQLPQPPKGKGKADGGDTASWGAAAEGDARSRPGETERQAKVRAMAERIRAEARAAAGGGPAPAQPEEEEAAAPAAAVAPEQEEEDARKAEAMLPKLEEKVAAAEDEAERVAILAAPLAMEATEELRELQLSSVRETERAVRAALATVGKARREVEARGKEVEAMAPQARASAKADIAKLAPRLDAVQASLEEHKNVRKDHELALQAEKLFGELASRLAGVEIDCEKAAMMADPLSKALDTNPQDITAAEIRETKEALRVAQATLAPTMRLISGKVAGLKGAVRSKMLDLQSRAESSQGLLDKTQRTVDEAQSRAQAAPILAQARERAVKVDEVLQKMRETEAPFLMGIETMPPEEAGDVLAKMDGAAAAAQSALADATKYVSLKTVEVGRFAENASEAARKELERIGQTLAEGTERVKAFQAEATKRRRMNLVEVVKARISEAEVAVAKMKEAGAGLLATEGAGLSAALEAAHAVELEAQNAVAAARRELQERQQEMRPLEGQPGKGGGRPGQPGQPQDMRSSSEILRTKVRVNYMETELTKFRKTAKDFEERIKVGKSLAEVQESLREAEEQVDGLATAAQDWPQDEKPPAEAEKGIASVQGKLSAATVQVETKLQTAQGLELRELRGIFSRLQRSQIKLDKVKDLSRERNRSISMRAVKETADAVQQAEAAVAVLGSIGAVMAAPLSKLETLRQQAATADEAVEAAREALAAGQGSETAAKVELARLQLRFKAVERRGRAAADAALARFEDQARAAAGQALDALRSAARREDGSYDAEGLFAELAEGASEVSGAQFCGFLAKGRGGPTMGAEAAKLALAKIAPHGLSHRAFVAALADFLTVARDITVTDEFEIQSAKKVRRLEIGEVVEALGETKEDSSLGLQRVKCRAVRDGTLGWVTVRSTAGTVYLERAEKPFLWCPRDVVLRSGAGADSSAVRELRAGEVLELVEGPREEQLGSDLRVRGAACSGDEAAGWLQIRDKSGSVLAKLSSSIYKCTEAIAMTDTADFATCNMVRRIDSGEALELVAGEEQAKPGEGGTRRKFRACRDAAEGWVTVEGSQGTVYVKVAPKHYVCAQASPVHAGLGAESAVVRVLMAGEAFAGFEEPKEVAGGETTKTYKARAVMDGKEGWVTATSAGEVAAWSARCEILRTAPLTKGFPANEAAEVIEVVRLLEPGEVVDITEQPMEDSSSGQLRACCVARKDKAVGWVTVREGTVLQLRPAAPPPAAPAPAARPAPSAGGAVPSAARAAPTPAPPAPPAPTKRPWTQAAGGGDGQKGGGKRYKGKGKGK